MPVPSPFSSRVPSPRTARNCPEPPVTARTLWGGGAFTNANVMVPRAPRRMTPVQLPSPSAPTSVQLPVPDARPALLQGVVEDDDVGGGGPRLPQVGVVERAEQHVEGQGSACLASLSRARARRQR